MSVHAGPVVSLRSGGSQIDWSETWGPIDGLFHIDYTLVESHPDWPFTLLTEISLACDEGATKRYEQFRAQGLDWFGRAAITETLCGFAAQEKIEILLRDQHPRIVKLLFQDSKRDMSYRAQIRCRRLGQDNGKDQLVKVTNYIEQIREQIRTTARRPSHQELERLRSLL